MKRKLTIVKTSSITQAKPDKMGLLADVREMILKARASVARTVDASLALHYWEVGRRIRQDILKEKRAEYGAEIVVTLSRQLEREFGRGYADKNLRRMVQFAEVFPASKIVVTLSRQLGWSHFAKSAEHVELLEVEKSGIHVAAYWTQVLPKAQLVKRLHQVVRLARQRLQTHDKETIEDQS